MGHFFIRRSKSMYQFTKFFILLTLSTCPLFADIVEVETEKELLQYLMTDGKPVPGVIRFSTTWCPGCQTVKQVFEDTAAGSALADVTFVHVDGDKGKELMKKFNVSSFPTFILVNGIDEKYRTHFFDSNSDNEFKKNLTAKVQKLLLEKSDTAKKLINGTIKKSVSPFQWLKQVFVSIWTSIQNFFKWIINSISSLFTR